MKKTCKPIVLPRSFSGEEELWGDYLEHFQSCCEINEWSLNECRQFLGVSLKGTAQQLFSDLPEDEKYDFKKIIYRFGEHFAPDLRSVNRAQLRVRVRAPGESLTALCASIRRSIGRAYPKFDSGVRSELGIGAFIDEIDDKELRRDLRKADPHSLEDGLSTALHLETVGKCILFKAVMVNRLSDRKTCNRILISRSG